jgi:hypothetical protein
MFSSAVPVQLVPSTWQAFHDGIARVAARMSVITSALSASVRSPDDVPPAFVVVSGDRGCGCAVMVLLRMRDGAFRLKEPETVSNTLSDKIQSCQMGLLGIDGMGGTKGWNPRTHISWMMNREGNGA